MNTCVLCGKDLDTSRAKYCPEKCKPRVGAVITCTVCGEVKDYSEYYDHRPSAGFYAECRDCRRARASAYKTRQPKERLPERPCKYCGTKYAPKRKDQRTCGRADCKKQAGKEYWHAYKHGC